jgi:dipeptidyl aminopeptidase/acylaminoacyl peptidase
LAKGRVRRLQWFTAFGSEAFGDLVLPVRYRPGQRYPLIVVQYVTRGFLRGGTGDEYPIQVFANNGFAVLSIERPRSPAIAPNARSYTDLDKADLAGFLDKRNVLSAIERGVRNLVDAGIVDERRVGITGLSDGASTVQYAGVHSKMFAAAVMSNCCAEPTQLALLGPAAAKLFREVGWPDLTSEAPSFWSNISWVVNARRIPFPVLLQMADSEYRSGLAAFTALREADVAIEMRVFPNETHFKWQPIHRLSIYTRNLNWFSFWLQNDLLSSNSQSNEIARWDDLKRGYSEAIDNVGSQRQP